MKQFQEMQGMRVIEKYGPFSPNAKENPCMRGARGPICIPWGFAIGEFMESIG